MVCGKIFESKGWANHLRANPEGRRKPKAGPAFRKRGWPVRVGMPVQRFPLRSIRAGSPVGRAVRGGRHPATIHEDFKNEDISVLLAGCQDRKRAPGTGSPEGTLGGWVRKAATPGNCRSIGGRRGPFCPQTVCQRRKQRLQTLGKSPKSSGTLVRIAGVAPLAPAPPDEIDIGR